MVWYWMMLGVLWIKKMLMPPSINDVKTIRTNSRCPVCGARKGKLRAVSVPVENQAEKMQARLFCQRTCLVCGSRSFQHPVLDKAHDQNFAWSAIPRDEIERKEDEQLVKRLVTPRNVAVVGTAAAKPEGKVH